MSTGPECVIASMRPVGSTPSPSAKVHSKDHNGRGFFAVAGNPAGAKAAQMRRSGEGDWMASSAAATIAAASVGVESAGGAAKAAIGNGAVTSKVALGAVASEAWNPGGWAANVAFGAASTAAGAAVAFAGSGSNGIGAKQNFGSTGSTRPRSGPKCGAPNLGTGAGSSGESRSTLRMLTSSQNEGLRSSLMWVQRIAASIKGCATHFGQRALQSNHIIARCASPPTANTR
mmetsp:Transcript_22330/g.63953  ORF Transcript_22330/g.63953 Transcript_22330/m.63953 type:complete len:231 (+) Transcript_22330:1171-1863(+)